MKQQDINPKPPISDLVSAYEAMSQKGTVAFHEETVFSKLIDYYETTEDFGKALEVTQHAMSQHPYTAAFYLRKAELLLLTGQDDQALNTLTEAEMYSPSETEILLLRAEILAAKESFQEALCILDTLKDNANPNDLASIYLIESHVFERQQRFNEQYDALKAALLADPGCREALEDIYLCVEFCQNYRDSARLHQKLTDMNPYSELAWYNLGHAFHALGELEKAAEAFEFAFLIDENFEFAYRDLAEIFIETGQYQQALNCLEEAECNENITPDSNMLSRMGFCLEKMEDYDAAKVYYFKALKVNPDNHEVHYRLGECYVHETKWKQAIGCYCKAIALNSRLEEYHAALGAAYYQTGDHEKAIDCYQKATEVAPEEPTYWLQFATFLMDIGAEGEAYRILEEAEIYSYGPQLVYCRATCLILMGRRKEGLYWLGEALADEPEAHSCIFDFVPELENDQEVLRIIESYL